MVQLATERPFGNITGQRKPGQEGTPFYNYGADTWSPAVNLYETEGVYLVCVDLSGVDKDKIDVEVLSGELTLRGHRAVPWMDSRGQQTEAKLRVHVMEIDHGSFCRTVELPKDAAQEKITATYRDGLLWIEIPKK